MVGSVTAWVSSETNGSECPPGTLKEVAPNLLSRLERKVHRRGRHIVQRSEDELHALRRAVKQLRYGIAFVRPLFKARLVKPYLHACEQLQESLGELNDLANAARLARQLDGDPALSGAAVEAVAAHLENRKSLAIGGARAGWRTFSKVDPFWT